jgi:hypothetical protein
MTRPTEEDITILDEPEEWYQVNRRPLTMKMVTVVQHSKTFVWIRLPGVEGVHIHRRVHGDVHQIIQPWDDTQIAAMLWVLADQLRIVDMLTSIRKSGRHPTDPLDMYDPFYRMQNKARDMTLRANRMMEEIDKRTI